MLAMAHTECISFQSEPVVPEISLVNQTYSSALQYMYIDIY